MKILKLQHTTLLIISALIFPIALLSPISMWILLFFPSLFFFYLKKNKLEYFQKPDIAEYLIVIFVLFSCISLFWTNNTHFGIQNSISISFLLISFLIINKEKLTFPNIKSIERVFLISYLATTIFILMNVYFELGIKPWLGLLFDKAFTNKEIEVGSYFSFFKNLQKGTYSGSYHRALTVISVFFFIIASLFHKYKVLVLFTFIITFFTLYFGGNTTALISFSLGTLVCLLFYVLGKSVFFPLAVLIVLYSILSPLIFKNLQTDLWYKKNSSTYVKKNLDFKNESNLLKNIIKKVERKSIHRLIIWSFSSEKIFEKIFIGHGLSSSRKIGESKKIELIEERDYKIINKESFSSIPLHTHNNTIQIWLELGAIGIILFYSFLILFWYKIVYKYPLKKTQSYCISGCIITIFLINQSSYGLWQPWWIASVMILIIFFKIFNKNYDGFIDITKIPRTIKQAPNQ